MWDGVTWRWTLVTNNRSRSGASIWENLYSHPGDMQHNLYGLGIDGHSRLVFKSQ